MISYNRALIAEIESICLTNIRRSNNKTKSIIKIRVQKLRLIEYITFDCYLIASSHWTLLSPLVEVGECFLFLSNSLANKSSIVCGCDVACLDRGTLDERSPFGYYILSLCIYVLAMSLNPLRSGMEALKVTPSECLPSRI